jgi:CRP-like cAMP-binding protein
MNKISIIQNDHNSGFQEMPHPPLFWMGPYRLRLLRLRDRIVPWQVRHFYYHHEAEAQVGALLSIALLFSHVLTLALQAVAGVAGYPGLLRSGILHGGGLFASGLKSLARRVRVARGTLLYREAQPANELMVLVEGYGRLYVEHEASRRLTVGLVGPGDLFGEEALLDEPERESSFEAILNSQVDVVTREDFMTFVTEHPAMLRSITEHLAQQLLAQQRHMIRLAFEPVERRLSWILLQLATANGTISTTEPNVPIYHKELAAVLGVWRETITATLNRWNNEGIIAQRPGHVILKDLARLQQMAEEP